MAWTVDSWRSDAYDPAVDGEPLMPVVKINGATLYPAWFDKRNAWTIREDDWSDLGLDDWA